MAPKIQAGVSIDPDVWNKFKEKFKGRASQELEDYMKWRLKNLTSEYPKIYSSADVRSFNFNLDQWNMNIDSGYVQVNNVSFTNTSNAASTDATILACNTTTAKDIIIE
jgi:hypothetical protein